MVKELPHFKDLQFLADDVTNFGDEVCILNDVLKSVIDSGDWRDAESGKKTPEEYADIILIDSIDFANTRGYQILYIYSKIVERVNKKFGYNVSYNALCDIEKRLYCFVSHGDYDLESSISTFTEFEFHKIYDGLHLLNFEFFDFVKYEFARHINRSYNIIEIYDYYKDLEVEDSVKEQMFIEFIDTHITDDMIMLMSISRELPNDIRSLFNMVKEDCNDYIDKLNKEFSEFMNEPFKGYWL